MLAGAINTPNGRAVWTRVLGLWSYQKVSPRIRGLHLKDVAPAFRNRPGKLLGRKSGFFSFLLKEFLLFGRPIRRFELNGQLAELAGKAERRLIVLVVHAGAGIDTDIERLIDGEERRHGVRDGLLSYFLAVN